MIFIYRMASVAGSSFSVSVRGHISHCDIPQLAGELRTKLTTKIDLE